MPRKKARPQPNQQELLDKVPANATRVKVETELGKIKYKAVNRVAVTDIILTTKEGDPIVMKRKPGRAIKPEVGPDNAIIAETLAHKARTMAEDDVLQTAIASPESADVLHKVMVGMAGEAASLRFERQEAERKGQGTSQLSLRRVNALKGVADTWLRRKEQLVNHSVDIEGPGFGILFQHIMETFRGSMEDSGVHPEMIKVVFARFQVRVVSEEWKNDAKARMRKNI